MHITVTYLKLRSPWKVFQMAKHVGKIQQQAKQSPGFIQMATTGWWKLWFTLSAWESEETLKQFARSGAHLEAMKISTQLSPELSTYTFEAAQVPDWKEAKRLLAAHGKVMRLPSPAKPTPKK